MNNKPMLNAYPDSLGGKLSDIAALLKKKEMQDTFSSFYILPSLYHSDLDRGFSVVDYNLNEELATIEDLSQLKELGIDLKLDFILNHASAQSPQFKDLVEKGDESEYRDFFIDWNKFWEGHGVMTDEGYIQLYGMDRLHHILNQQCQTCGPEKTLELVKADIDAFAGDNNQSDDITMLCLEYTKKMEG